MISGASSQIFKVNLQKQSFQSGTHTRATRRIAQITSEIQIEGPDRHPFRTELPLKFLFITCGKPRE